MRDSPRTHRAKWRGRSGAILMEALVALTILTAGISVIAQGFSLGLQASSLARSRSTAARLAADKLVEVETSDLARLSNEAGDFGEDYPGFTWEITVEEADLPDLRRIHAVVRWVRRGIEREVKLSRLLYTATGEEGLP